MRYQPFLFALLVAVIPNITFAQGTRQVVSAAKTIPTIDRVVQQAMQRVGASAATITISNDRRVLYSTAYGWADANKSVPVEPKHIFRIASNTKPFTAATVRKLIATGQLSATTPVFKFLDLAPYDGKVGDPRLAAITVENLLSHKGGWDKKKSFDPMYKLDEISRTLKLSEEINSVDIIRFMLAQPLQHTPGQTYAYSNFGYVVLSAVIAKVTGQAYLKSVQAILCEPLGIDDLRLTAFDPRECDPLEIHYPRQIDLKYHTRASAGGLSTSSVSLCQFLKAYWISGEPRQPGRKSRFYHFGSMPSCTTALMEQRADGINYAVMLNARRDRQFKKDNDELRATINRSIDRLKSSR